MHLVEHALHQFHRARRAAHHAGAQAGGVVARKIVEPELRHVHCRNPVDARRALLVHRFQRGPRVESPVGQNDGRAGVHRAHGPNHASIAMKQRHRDHNLVLFGVMKSLRQKLSVIHHVVMRQHHALGQAGRPARVLDIRHIVHGHVIRQPALGVQQRRPLRRIEIDRVFERQVEPVTRAAQNLLVIGALVLVPQKQRLHPRARQRELQFVRAVRGIYIHQRRSSPRAAHVQDDPLGAVGRPQSHTVSAADAQRPQSPRHAIRLGAQFRPGQPPLLVARNHSRPVRIAIRRPQQQVANRQFQQRPCRPPRIALGQNLLVNTGHPVSASFSAMKGSVRRKPGQSV